MENIRCLIADIPQLMLADIVQRVAEKNTGIKIVDRLKNIENLPNIVKKKDIDVLILGMKNNILPQACDEAMKRVSNLLVIGLVDDGRSAVIYVDDVGVDHIVEAIKVFGRKSI